MITKKVLSSLPMEFSQTPIAKVAPHLPLSEVAKSAISKDYTTPKDRDEALLFVSREINDFFFQQGVVKNKNEEENNVAASDTSSKDANTETKTTSAGIYTPSALQVYDAFVWDFNSPFLWKISKDEIIDLYRDCIPKTSTSNHCEIAVGTGLFLEKMVRENRLNKVTLLDLNPITMDVCEKRLEEAATATGQSTKIDIDKIVYDVLVGVDNTGIKIIPKDAPFDSVAANFLIHCLHGGDEVTHTAISNIAQTLVHPTTGVFFGSTILGKDLVAADGDQKAIQAAFETLQLYNDWGIFGNLDDSYCGLANILQDCFEDVDLHWAGYCAVWKARRPRVKL